MSDDKPERQAPTRTTLESPEQQTLQPLAVLSIGLLALTVLWSIAIEIRLVSTQTWLEQAGYGADDLPYQLPSIWVLVIPPALAVIGVIKERWLRDWTTKLSVNLVLLLVLWVLCAFHTWSLDILLEAYR